MFDHINLAGISKSAQFGYAKDVPFFKGKKKLSFQPGLNILVGPNGSGKSTILKILGDSMCATQGGVSTVTETAVSSGVDMLGRLGKRSGGGMTDKLGVAVAHDGQPVVFCDPRQTVGLSGGAFDDDFFSEGLSEIMSGRKASHGQQAANRANLVLSILTGNAQFPSQVRKMVQRNHVNDVWKAALDVLEARLNPSIPTGQPTLLLDEPEANYSVVWQSRLWHLLAREAVAAKFQVIVASHSAFAFGIPHAHYIEMLPGYQAEAETALRSRFGS